jgi:hypothetical protein
MSPLNVLNLTFLGGLALYGLMRVIRSNYIQSVKPLMTVGARIKDSVINVKVLIVDKERRTMVVLEPDTKNHVEVSFDNIYLPTYRE